FPQGRRARSNPARLYGGPAVMTPAFSFSPPNFVNLRRTVSACLRFNGITIWRTGPLIPRFGRPSSGQPRANQGQATTNLEERLTPTTRLRRSRQQAGRPRRLGNRAAVQV